MSERNRVTPYGEIVASPLRGSWMGNRGCIHRGRKIVRPWAGKRWITCALEFRGWRAPKWEPGRWTALFFHDEAVALAAGHRPCALCRRADYRRYCDAAGLFDADAIDARLHADRLAGRAKRLVVMRWPEVPPGVFVDIGHRPYVVHPDRLREWDAQTGYGAARARPRTGSVQAITPALSILAIRLGFAPHIAS